MLKDLNLTQAQADKLMDFWNTHATKQADLAVKAVLTMREGWREAVAKDPIMGDKLESIKTDVGRMKDQILGPVGTRDRDSFDRAMDLTGAGDHPDIIRGWWKATKPWIEGGHVSGSSPSPAGQRAPGAPERPSLAAAMYPNLSH